MAFIIQLLFVSVISRNAKQRRATTSWTYDKQGENWGDNVAACNGDTQSPIDIDTNIVERHLHEDFLMSNYKKDFKWDVSNSGHGITLAPNDDDHILILGGALDSVYKLAQFHFHWGSSDTMGSEHLVNGKRHFAEVHLVHYKFIYGSVAEAVKHSDGLAVLGFFVDVDETADGALNDLIRNKIGKETLNVGDTHSLEFNLLEFQKAALSGYYRYMGSLTTPGCNEAVVWTIFEETIQISPETRDMMISFAQTPQTEESLVNNYREPQSLGERGIWHFTEDEPSIETEFDADAENEDAENEDAENEDAEIDDDDAQTVGLTIIKLLKKIVLYLKPSNRA